MATKNPNPTFSPIGSFGVECAVNGDELIIHVPLKDTKPSQTGKMDLFGSTGGWQEIAGSNGIRLNVMAGKRKQA